MRYELAYLPPKGQNRVVRKIASPEDAWQYLSMDAFPKFSDVMLMRVDEDGNADASWILDSRDGWRLMWIAEGRSAQREYRA